MLDKQTLEKFNQLDYTISVSYTNTAYMEANVDPASLKDAETTDDLDFINDEEESTEFDAGSENFSIWIKPNQNGYAECVTDGITNYEDLEAVIENIVANHEKKDWSWL